MATLTRDNSLDKRLFEIWRGMHKRCENPNHKGYERYGGRGIKICDEWNSFVKFGAWAISNGYKDNLTLDRIDNDGNYEPSNCRWSNWSEQMNNTCKGEHVLVHGKPKSFSIRKRNKTYEYRIEGKRENGKRKQYSKGGYKTKLECIEAAREFIFVHYEK